MGTLYFRKDTKKWRVQIREQGFKSISMTFDNIDDAKKFLEKCEEIIENKKTQKKQNEALNKLKRGNHGCN